MYWIEFFISAALIVAAGIHLTKYADRLSDALKLGKMLIGIILLGCVTSLPEAITCIISILKLDANDLAVGNLLGSNNFNLTLIVLMDIFYKQGSFTNTVVLRPSHKVSGLLSVVLMAIVAGEIMFVDQLSQLRIGYLTLGMISIGFIYCWGMSLLAKLESQHHVPVDEPGVIYPLPKIWFNLFISAAVVVVSAMWLTKSADVIADQTGLGRSFVGTILLACVTSLPEVVVTLSALRMGSFDLLLGNIFGSNMVNMFIMFLCAGIYTKGPIMQTVNPAHVITSLFGILMTFVVLNGISKQNKKVVGRMGVDSIIVLVLFITGLAIFYIAK